MRPASDIELFPISIRLTTHADLPQVMQIYETARHFMQQTGNSGQWVNGYPKKELIMSDIEQGCSFVCMDKHNDILAIFHYSEGEECTYREIYQGAWLNNAPYGVIHRIASAGKRKGIAEICINWCLEKCKNIRIDTHRDNKVMQNILQKLNFQYCGIIYLKNGAERLAFQKII